MVWGGAAHGDDGRVWAGHSAALLSSLGQKVADHVEHTHTPRKKF